MYRLQYQYRFSRGASSWHQIQQSGFIGGVKRPATGTATKYRQRHLCTQRNGTVSIGNLQLNFGFKHDRIRGRTTGHERQRENTRQILMRHYFSTNIHNESSHNNNNNNSTKEEETTKRKELKERKALQRVAIQSIPFWLKREPYCFDRTVQALNVNISSERWKNSTSLVADLPGEYQKAFNDSIPSFIDRLSFSEDLPQVVEDALDRLVEAGFSDVEFSKNYRSVKSNQRMHAQTTVLLEQKKKSLKQRETTITEIQAKIDELEQALKKLKSEREIFVQEHMPDAKTNDSDQKSTEESNLIESFLSYIQSIKKDKSAPETIVDEFAALKQKIERTERQLDGRKKHLETHHQGLANIQQAIENAKEQQASYRNTISTKVYEETQQTIHEVLLVLCDFLADHIQKRHSSLIQHYQNLDSKTGMPLFCCGVVQICCSICRHLTTVLCSMLLPIFA